MKSKSSHLSVIYAFLTVLMLMSASYCSAQTTGVLKGEITDPTGAVLSGATVSITGPDAMIRSETTDDRGRYRLVAPAPGRYDIRITAAGFADYAVSGVLVNPGEEVVLGAKLSLAAVKQEVAVEDNQQPTVDPSTNAGAIVLKGSDLNALSDDSDELANDLLALAGPAAGPNGGEIFVDGFSSATLPAKASIREIRVNQNPFSAEFDRLGYGRVEIFTKPGTDKFHTEIAFGINDFRFNSRNPFSTSKPPYQRRNYGFTFGGPLGQRASFFLNLERAYIGDLSVINATVLDSSFNVSPYQLSIAAPRAINMVSLRLDYQLATNNTLVGRYDWQARFARNGGLDTFSLPSRGFDSSDRSNTLQLTDTAILSPTSINELRFQYGRMYRGGRFKGSEPTLQVLDAFTSGNPGSGLVDTRYSYSELANVLSLSRGQHMVKLGGRLRLNSIENTSGQNYNGTYTFTSLDSYRTTMLGLRDGLSAQQIRLLGGGASQFSISTGMPSAQAGQLDGGLFLQDDWHLLPSFTLSGGLRYELQANIDDHLSIAPRIGFAWAPGARTRERAPIIVRGGFGLFYDRVRENLTMEARRLDGLHQRQYMVPNPDFYPAVPAAASLVGYESEQVVRRLDPEMRAPYMAQTAFSIERQFPKNVNVSLTYADTRGFRGLLSRNINAPLSDGLRPMAGGNIYEYESAGVFRQNQLTLNANTRVNRRISLSGYYVWSKAESNYDNQGSFPANPYDLRSDYGRAGFDVRHRMLISGTLAGPYKFSLNPFVSASSGTPFNIITGSDFNGDSIFNDRPAWATDMSRPSVVRTAYGTFDLNPIAGQQIIPRNLGEGPGALAVNMRLSRTFGFGERRGPAVAAAPQPVQAPMARGRGEEHEERGGRGGSGGSSGYRYSLTFSANVRNLLNSANLVPPVGNLSSPRFGESVGIVSTGHGGGTPAANRTIDFQVRLSF